MQDKNKKYIKNELTLIYNEMEFKIHVENNFIKVDDYYVYNFYYYESVNVLTGKNNGTINFGKYPLFYSL